MIECPAQSGPRAFVAQWQGTVTTEIVVRFHAKAPPLRTTE